ncbi:hypothetical protein ACQP3D_29425, partial [Escherichia coli]
MGGGKESGKKMYSLIFKKWEKIGITILLKFSANLVCKQYLTGLILFLIFMVLEIRSNALYKQGK